MKTMSGKSQTLQSVANTLAEEKMTLDRVLADGRVDDLEFEELLETRNNLHQTLGVLEGYLLAHIQAMCLLRYGDVSRFTQDRLDRQSREVERTYGKGRPNLKLVRPPMTPDDAA